MNLRLLYVEDDDDLRQMFSMMLVNEGYDVAAVSNAEDAILALQTERYDLLLTDYNLLNKNADWLLRVAEASGSLRDTRVVILTAERQPAGVDGYRILKKPVDIAVLFACLDEAVTKSAPAPASVCEAETPLSGVALELKLYVTTASRESIKAQRNLNRILRKFSPAGVNLEICDVTRGQLPVDALELDRIIVTPTLVRAWPLPKVWIFGDLSKSEPVEAMIAAGLERIAAPDVQPPAISEPLET
jgi:DNA-binding response OmpR family regulator